MEKIKYYLEKYKIIIILITLIIILGLSTIYVYLNQSNKENIEVVEVKKEVKEKEEIKEVEEIKVDIKGFVKEPNVYKMSNDDRVIDVINKAGGLKEGANTEYINLSKKVKDEMIIIIYSNDDVEKYKETDKEIIYIEYECICPDNKNDACIKETDTVNTNGVKEKDENSKEEKTQNDDKDNLISINTGTLEELMTLSSIGESKAQAIIDYREQNGEFKRLEDIMNVSGIGESAYSKIKDYIKL